MLAFAVAYLLHPYAVHLVFRRRGRAAAHLLSAVPSLAFVDVLWPPKLPA